MRKPSNCWNICKTESRRKLLRKGARNETLEWIFCALDREKWAHRDVRDCFGCGVLGFGVWRAFEGRCGRACVAAIGRGGGAEVEWGSGTDSGDVYGRGAGECAATAGASGVFYTGSA